ncbi:MAG: uroporphyrinogen-III decarboxylase-like protein [Anaerolineae bacterium]|nr:uroporphyrinogen-III decarboxylase-like protein [Anaerolineae bacterium]
MPQETMTPRERWLAVLNRRQPDRVPMDYWATPETDAKLMRHLGCDDVRAMLRKLHVDYVVTVAPRYVGPPVPRNMNVFGVLFKPVDYGAGVYDEVVSHPLAEFRTVDEIKRRYLWPEPDWWDYSDIAAQVEGQGDYPIQGGGSEPFLIYAELRGQEQAYMDLVLNPEMVHYCLDKLFELAYQNTLRIFEQIPGQVTLSYVAEDMGGQEDLLFAPAHIHEFLIPRMKRMIDLVHEARAFVFHHSDGAIRRIIPDMIEAGIDILNPIQWRTKGMDRAALKRDVGDRVVFHGGMDNQYALPFGTVAEVRQEVRDNLRILGEGGGYILAPCHNIQSNTPLENIVALYETGYAEGWT